MLAVVGLPGEGTASSSLSLDVPALSSDPCPCSAALDPAGALPGRPGPPAEDDGGPGRQQLHALAGGGVRYVPQGPSSSVTSLNLDEFLINSF